MQGDERELEQYRRLVSSVRDYAIFLLDPDGHVVTWNAGARVLKGYEAEEIIGRHFSTFYTDADRARDHPANELRLAIRDGRYEEEGWRVRKDGTTFWATVTITALRDDDGRLTGFAKVTRDLTERKHAADELHRALEELRHANAELDRFASVAAHDMTDPLRTISGFAEVLVHADDLKEEDAREYAQHILDSSLRLTGMLRGLLTYARAGRPPGTAEPVGLPTVTDQVLRDLAAAVSERGTTVTRAVPDDACVAAEVHDVRLLLQNLVSNALKFAEREVTIAAERHDGGWRVTVADDGPGIAEEDREAIFAAFRRGGGRADRGGYGLGLAIAQRLAERHGGRLGLDVPAGGGSRFWFTLPGADAG